MRLKAWKEPPDSVRKICRSSSPSRNGSGSVEKRSQSRSKRNTDQAPTEHKAITNRRPITSIALQEDHSCITRHRTCKSQKQSMKKILRQLPVSPGFKLTKGSKPVQRGAAGVDRSKTSIGVFDEGGTKPVKRTGENFKTRGKPVGGQ